MIVGKVGSDKCLRTEGKAYPIHSIGRILYDNNSNRPVKVLDVFLHENKLYGTVHVDVIVQYLDGKVSTVISSHLSDTVGPLEELDYLNRMRLVILPGVISEVKKDHLKGVGNGSPLRRLEG